jgi:hypothetical protein
MEENGEVVFFGLEEIAGELSRVTRKRITAQRAAYWIKRGVIRARKAGHFRSATRASIQADLSPEEQQKAEAS